MYGKIGILLLAACTALPAQAKEDSTQAARLGQDLTPLGAERGGNPAGTIPPWTGGVAAPAGYEPGMHHPDPYAADTVLYRVDHTNINEYSGQLYDGMKALLERYPDYHLRVFPTRRSASVPQRIYDATRYNAVSAELIANGNGIQGAAAGIPFPIPQSGIEVIWNHILHYKGDQSHMINNQAVVIGGRANYIKRDRHIYYVYDSRGPGQHSAVLQVPCHRAGQAVRYGTGGAGPARPGADHSQGVALQPGRSPRAPSAVTGL